MAWSKTETQNDLQLLYSSRAKLAREALHLFGEQDIFHLYHSWTLKHYSLLKFPPKEDWNAEGGGGDPVFFLFKSLCNDHTQFQLWHNIVIS